MSQKSKYQQHLEEEVNKAERLIQHAIQLGQEYLTKKEMLDFLKSTTKENPRLAYIVYNFNKEVKATEDVGAIASFSRKGEIYADLMKGVAVFVLDPVLGGIKRSLDEYGSTWAIEAISWDL